MKAPVRLPLSSAAEHAKAREEWELFFADSVRRLGLKRKWIDWMNMSYDGLIPEDESFTILSKKCEHDPVGFSFHLYLPEAGGTRVGSYWRTFGEGMMPEPVRHFVISAEGDPASIAEGREILLRWLQENEERA